MTLLLTKEVTGREGWGTSREMPYNVSFCPIFQVLFLGSFTLLNFFFSLQSLYLSPQLLLVFTPIMSVKAICEVNWKLFGKRGCMDFRNAESGPLSRLPSLGIA